MQEIYKICMPPLTLIPWLNRWTDCHDTSFLPSFLPCSSLPELHSRYTTASNQLALLQSQLSSDVDLDSQKLVVSNIGSAINARAGVSRIPTEIRGTILAYLCADWPPFLVRTKSATQGSDAAVESEGASKLTLDLAWIKATHASRLWREAGLAFGDLWSGIDTHLFGIKWSAEMLARSRGTPLTLTHRYAPDSHNGHQLLAEAIPQSKSLEVDAFRADGCLLEILQKRAAPNLEELFLQSASTIYIGENDVVASNFFTLPEVLFDSSTSRLRVLVLDSVIPSWTSPLFSTANISYLSVSFDTPYPGGLDVLQDTIDMPPADLLSALSSLGPSLEVLILVNCLPLIEKWKGMPSRGPVTLPSLRRIEVTCDSLEVLFAFTGYLTVTGTVRRLDFEVDSLDDSSINQSDIWIQGMYSRLLGLIRSFCFATPSFGVGGSQDLRAFDSLSIELTPDPRVVTDDEDEEDPDGIQPFLTLELKSESQSSPTSSPPQQQSPRIHVSMPLDLPMTSPMVTLRLLEMLPAPWTQLKSLHISNSVTDADGNPFRGLWTDKHVDELVARLGGGLSELETLDSGSGFSESITDALRFSDPAAVFPKLSAITMEDDSELYLKDNFELWISDPRPHWPRAGSNSSGLSDLFGAIYHVLMIREGSGSKISRLRLTPWISTERVLPDDGEDVEMSTVGLTEEWTDAFRELEREIEPLVGTVKISFTSPREEESLRMQKLYTSMLVPI